MLPAFQPCQRWYRATDVDTIHSKTNHTNWSNHGAVLLKQACVYARVLRLGMATPRSPGARAV